MIQISRGCQCRVGLVGKANGGLSLSHTLSHYLSHTDTHAPRSFEYHQQASWDLLSTMKAAPSTRARLSGGHKACSLIASYLSQSASTNSSSTVVDEALSLFLSLSLSDNNQRVCVLLLYSYSNRFI